ncbi:hypothetical protein RUM44_000421 [Polyplax serrata]|uniref:Uncharacterized protein n=1 Tax=Polyplax serrata TaxID=468196 RepID=A0ABR1B6L2_POLSC
MADMVPVENLKDLRGSDFQEVKKRTGRSKASLSTLLGAWEPERQRYLAKVAEQLRVKQRKKRVSSSESSICMTTPAARYLTRNEQLERQRHGELGKPRDKH